VVTSWLENLRECSRDELLLLEAENREWNKQLRLQATALVNARLAKQIGLEDYAASRLRAKDDAAECKQRATLLHRELVNWISHPLPHPNPK
jgi:hypothetical protein